MLVMIPSRTNFYAPPGTWQRIDYLVQNVSGITFSNLTYDVNYPDNSNVTVNQANTTCGTTLAAGSSCTLSVLVLIGPVGVPMVISPRICSANGMICSTAECSNRAIINPLLPQLTLSLDLLPDDQHLQAKALILTNTGIFDVTLNNFGLTASANLGDHIVQCNAANNCVPPTGSYPDCAVGQELAVGQSCLIWVKSVDDKNNVPVGITTGTITINVGTTPGSNVNNNVLTTNYNNFLYAGGAFTNTVLGSPRIIYWDGSTWHGMMSGANTGTVQALLAYQHDLYLGGSFTSASGVADTTRIAVWNGSEFVAVPVTQTIGNGTVTDFTDYNGQLAIAGTFTSGTPSNRIMLWDGSSSTYTPLLAGISNGSVFSVATYQGNLYMTGNFSQVPGITTTNIAGWNGSAFFELEDGISSMPAVPRVVWAVDGLLFVGGGFTNQYGGSYILSWNGSAFAPLSGTGINGAVFALGTYQDMLLLGGQFSVPPIRRIAYWDGVYHNFANGLGGQTNTVDSAALEVYAGNNNDVYLWNGISWVIINSSSNGSVARVYVTSSVTFG